MIKKHKYLILVLILAFFLRFIKLDMLPLSGDETDVALQSESLSLNLKDYKGNFFPAYIQSFNESRAPLLMYVTVPGIKFFGVNTYTIRLIPLFFGLLSIFFLYRLILLLSQSAILAIFSSTVLALSPWHIHYSRMSYEVTLLLSLILAGTYFFYRYCQKNSLFNHITFIFLFSLSFYTYNTANIFVPLLAIFLLIQNRQSIKNWPKFINLSLIFTFILTVPLIYQIINGSAKNRFQLISIFNDQATLGQIVAKRTDFSSSGNNLSEKLLHNRPIAYSMAFLNNYSASFDPQFLFFKSDSNPRHSVPQFGLLLFPLAIPLIFGLLNFKFKPLNQLMLFWLLIAPIASSLTQGGGQHATRLFLMIVPLVCLISEGLVILVKKYPLFFYLIIIISSLQLASYFHEYFVHYPKQEAKNWQYGYSQLFPNIPTTYRHLFISNREYTSLPQFLYHQKYDLEKIQVSPNLDQDRSISEYQLQGFPLGSDITFVDDWKAQDVLEKIQKMAQPDDIFVLLQLKDIPGDMNFSQKSLPGFSTITTVFNPDGSIFGQIVKKL